MKGFLRFYKWELNNEMFCSFYFVAMLSMYSIEMLLHGVKNINIFIMLEMLFLGYALSLVQKITFSNDSNANRKVLLVKTIIWFVSSLLLIIVSSIMFQWFVNLQTWAMGVFIGYMVLFLIAIWVGIHIANKIDTKNLNDMLSHYQEKSK